MGSRSRSPMLFVATANAGAVTLQAGSLSGVTSGSRFALYASQADAVARRAQLATATVVGLDDGTAQLKLDAQLLASRDLQDLALEPAALGHIGDHREAMRLAVDVRGRRDARGIERRAVAPAALELHGGEARPLRCGA